MAEIKEETVEALENMRQKKEDALQEARRAGRRHEELHSAYMTLVATILREHGYAVDDYQINLDTGEIEPIKDTSESEPDAPIESSD